MDVMTGRLDHALLYDSDCGFCKWSVELILRADRDERLRPVAIQDEEGQRLLAAIPESRRLESWHLLSPGGSVVSAGTAAAPLARLLPGGRLPARLFERFPGATERVYRWVARHRSGFGRIGLRR